MKNIGDQKKRFIKFALVGISGTIIDFGFFNLFSSFLGVPALIASVFSFSIAVVNNFYWNRLWTYPESKNTNLANQLTKFGVVSVLGLVIRTPLFALIENPMINAANSLLPALFPIEPGIVGHNIALASVIVVVLFWNYFVNRFWTYRNLEPVKRSEDHGS